MAYSRAGRRVVRGEVTSPLRLCIRCWLNFYKSLIRVFWLFQIGRFTFLVPTDVKSSLIIRIILCVLSQINIEKPLLFLGKIAIFDRYHRFFLNVRMIHRQFPLRASWVWISMMCIVALLQDHEATIGVYGLFLHFFHMYLLAFDWDFVATLVQHVCGGLELHTFDELCGLTALPTLLYFDILFVRWVFNT